MAWLLQNVMLTYQRGIYVYIYIYIYIERERERERESDSHQNKILSKFNE
jgi:hypothetical protein